MKSKIEERPNILVIQADQLAAPALPIYGHPVVQAPHLQLLAVEGIVFENAYCNFPLCAPSRVSMLTGQLASRVAAFDNGSEFPASIPTVAHYLRYLGYRTCLSGKMHFIGPDQLHGFEERITTDIYPASFLWTAEWSPGGPYSLIDPKDPTPRGGMRAVLESGVRARTMQIDYDEETIHRAKRWLFNVARDTDTRPFFLFVSFTHPHDPYTTTLEYWNRYRDSEIDLPRVRYIPPDKRDPMTAPLYDYFGIDAAHLQEQHLLMTRHAYYGSISYVDDKIGELLACLKQARLENTVVIVTSDHGDMLGERGLWYKRSFFEWAVRIPLVIHAPRRYRPGRVSENVSLVDLLPTITALASPNEESHSVEPLDGRSLLPLMNGDNTGWPDTVLSEILCEGTSKPLFMIRRGAFKYMHSGQHEPLLFNCVEDPDELHNLAGLPNYAELTQRFRNEVEQRWDSERLSREVRLSQERRLFVYQALSKGKPAPWDYIVPSEDSDGSYFRGGVPYDDFFGMRDLPSETERGY